MILISKRTQIFLTITVLFLQSSARDVPARVFPDDDISAKSFAPMLTAIPYSTDFESGTTGWTTTFRHDPRCTTCSDISWNWVSNPAATVVAHDLFPARVVLPELADGDTVAHLPPPHSGIRAYWCGNTSNGTFVGMPYDPLRATSIEPEPFGNSYNWMQASLFTPDFNTAGATELYMSFWTWWEVEAIDIYTFDVMEIGISVDGAPFVALDTINPPFSRLPGWSENHSYSSGGYLTYGQWVFWNFDLSAYAGHTIRIRFLFDTVDDNYNAFRGWMIDDFYIGTGPQHGALDYTFTTPSDINALLCRHSPNPFDATLKVWNSGGATVHDVRATISLPRGLHPLPAETIANIGNLTPAETIIVNWRISIDDTVFGAKNLRIKITSADSAHGYFDNFETGASLFTGTPYFAQTNTITVSPRAASPPSGVNFAGIPRSGGLYLESALNSLTSRELDLTGFTECYISFWHWINVRESGFLMRGIDGGIVEINVNSTGWQQLDEFATGMLTPRYTGYIQPGASSPISMKLAYCNDTREWVQVKSLDLVALGYCTSGDRLRVRFSFGTGAFSRAPDTTNGWFIDNFALSSSGHPVGPFEATRTINIAHVFPMDLSFAHAETIICKGDTATLEANAFGSGTFTFNWFPNYHLTSQTSASTTVYPDTTTTYTCEVRNSTGCVDSITARVHVNNIRVDLPASFFVCASETTTLSASCTGGFGARTYTWNTPTWLTRIDSLTYRGVALSSGWAKISATDTFGCTSYDSVFIRVNSEPTTFSQALPVGGAVMRYDVVTFVWHSSIGAERYLLIFDNTDTFIVTDTFFTGGALPCDTTLNWKVVALNSCGTISTPDRRIVIEPCSSPVASIVTPPRDAVTACEDQQIIINLTDPDGIVPSSIRLRVNGMVHSVGGGAVTYSGNRVIFNDPSAYADTGYVHVCLDSACDATGYILTPPFCWNFATDFLPPSLTGANPVGAVDILPDTAFFVLTDAPAGLDTATLYARITIDGTTTTLTFGSGIDTIDGRFAIDLDRFALGVGDSMRICVHAQDTPDLCEPNELDTCWSITYAPCRIIAAACADVHLCPGSFFTLGANPVTRYGYAPVDISWSTASAGVFSHATNPLVSPTTTTTYFLHARDSRGCEAFDTVTVFVDFEPVHAIEPIAPNPTTPMSYGDITLAWRPHDGTGAITYTVFVDGIPVITDLAETTFTYRATACNETHFWHVTAEQTCTQSIPRCDTTGVIAVRESTYFFVCDSFFNPWELSSSPASFYVRPCDLPTASIIRPFLNATSACVVDTVIFQITSPHGIDSASVVVSYGGTLHTLAEEHLRLDGTQLIFDSLALDHAETTRVCLTLSDTFGNTLAGDSLCTIFSTDFMPPSVTFMPPSGTTCLSPPESLIITLSHWRAFPNLSSIYIAIGESVFASTHPCLFIDTLIIDDIHIMRLILRSCNDFHPCDTYAVHIGATVSTDYCVGNALIASTTLFTDCTEPVATVISPRPDVLTSCDTETLRILLVDAAGNLDFSSVVLEVSGYGTISAPDSRLFMHGDTLFFAPIVGSLPEEGTITARLLSATDSMGNVLSTPLEWSFRVDRIAPAFEAPMPFCGAIIDETEPILSVAIHDSGCGLNLSTAFLTLSATDTFTYLDGELTFDSGRLIFDPSAFGVSFSGGDTIDFCFGISDCASSRCPENSSVLCCTAYVSTGGPIAEIRTPSSQISACSTQTIAFALFDSDGIVTESVTIEFCTGDCSHCATYPLSDLDITMLESFDDSLIFSVIIPATAYAETICANVIHATDILGNTLIPSTTTWQMFFDFDAPVLYNPLPFGDLTDFPTHWRVNAFDSLSGIDAASITVTRTIGVTTTSTPFSFDGDSIFGTLDSLSPGDCITLCTRLNDAPDICSPSIAETCWSFCVPACSLRAFACIDREICITSNTTIGSTPAAIGIFPPFTYVWLCNGETLSTEATLSVAPTTTSEYILIVIDSLGCVASDTVTVTVLDFIDTSLATLSPVSNAILPPGIVEFTWSNVPNAHYIINIDDTILHDTGTDTTFAVSFSCGTTHTWNVTSYIACTTHNPMCIDDTLHFSDDTTTFDFATHPSVFEILPCNAPVFSIDFPTTGTIFACETDTAQATIFDTDGIVESTIIVTLNDEIVPFIWMQPIAKIPLPHFEHDDTFVVCVRSAADIYGNVNSTPVCATFFVDRAAPAIIVITPSDSSTVSDRIAPIVFELSDDFAGIEFDSLHFFIRNTDFTASLSHSFVVDELGDTIYTLTFTPQTAGITFTDGETIRVSVRACDSPDFCANCDEHEVTFFLFPASACNRAPNPFTPDANSINDIALFEYPNMYSTDATLKIFDTHGHKIFETVMVANAPTTRSWRGTNSDGEPAPIGTYIYIIECNGEIVCNGTITIAR